MKFKHSTIEAIAAELYPDVHCFPPDAKLWQTRSGQERDESQALQEAKDHEVVGKFVRFAVSCGQERELLNALQEITQESYERDYEHEN